MDAYAYKLLSIYEPDAVVGLRVVATIRPLPCPTLVASRTAPADMVSALRQALLCAHESEDGRAALRPLAIERFDCPDVANYSVLARGGGGGRSEACGMVTAGARWRHGAAGAALRLGASYGLIAGINKQT